MIKNSVAVYVSYPWHLKSVDVWSDNASSVHRFLSPFRRLTLPYVVATPHNSKILAKHN